MRGSCFFFLGFSCCWFGCALPEIVFPPNNTFPPSTIDPTGLEIKEGSRYISLEREYISDLCSVPCIKCIRDVTRGSPNETIVHSNIYSLNLHLGSNGWTEMLKICLISLNRSIDRIYAYLQATQNKGSPDISWLGWSSFQMKAHPQSYTLPFII